MTHLIFDARQIEREFTGLGRYTGFLLLGTLRARIFSRVTVLANLSNVKKNALWAQCTKAIEEEKLSGIQVDIEDLNVPLKGLVHHFGLGSRVNHLPGDIYFYPHFDVPKGITKKVVFVIHDLLPLVVPLYIRRLRSLKRWYFRWWIRGALATPHYRCVAVSETTRRDLAEYGLCANEDRITVALEGPTLSFERDVLPRPYDEPYLLYVGDRRPHKNIPAMVHLYRDLVRTGAFRGKLVLAGSKASEPLSELGIVELGNVSDNVLVSLYQHCEAVLLLSSYEGFGLPVVEAAVYGKRMILASRGSLNEIAPPWAKLVDPGQYDIEELGEYLSSKAPSPVEVERYTERFNWEEVSRRAFGCLQYG